MKSQYESSLHTKIRKQGEEDKKAARLWKITGDRAVHILTDTLTHGERWERRERAGIQKKPRPHRMESAPEIKPEKIDNRPLIDVLTIDAIQQFLSELWEVKIREDRDGFYWASIPWVTLENSLLQPEAKSRSEIMGRNSDEALRSYFKNATTPGTHMLKWDDAYDWKLADLTFMKRIYVPLSQRLDIRKKKIQRRRILGKVAQWEEEK